MRPTGAVVVLVSLLSLSAAVGPRAAVAQEDRTGVVVRKNVMVPMRDGVRLATDIYLPARDGETLAGPFPVIVERTPYDKESDRSVRRGMEFARRGYVVVYQDVRGRFRSEGRWWMLVDDDTDGYDLMEWVHGQPWCEGRIGTMGGSYTGATQHALAITRPPGLSAMFIRETISNMGKVGLRHRGAFELRFMSWIFGRAADSPEARADPVLRAALVEGREQLHEYVMRLPFKKGATPLRHLPNYEDWLYTAMTHSDYDEYWKQPGYNVEEHYDEYADVPVYHETGWYDSWTLSTIENYVGLAERKRSPQRLIVGPWTHGGAERTHSGDVAFGAGSSIGDYDAFMEAWFDRWLKDGVGPANESPIRIFVMGGGSGRKDADGRLLHGGRWRDEDSWPVRGTRFTPYHLHADGRLGPDAPEDSPPSRYTFDPRDPVPTIGGNISSAGGLMSAGGFDQVCGPEVFGCEDRLPLAARNDVLVFETPPLERDVEVTGPVEVRLWVSSSAPDTDFTAKLVDVHPPNPDYPRGYALNLSDSITRLRYRHGLGEQDLLEPGRVAEVTVTLYPVSNVFKAGHRIRIDISSSNFPRFDVNPNTGEPLGKNRRWTTADNSVHHDPERPSHVLLPVVER